MSNRFGINIIKMPRVKKSTTTVDPKQPVQEEPVVKSTKTKTASSKKSVATKEEVQEVQEVTPDVTIPEPEDDAPEAEESDDSTKPKQVKISLLESLQTMLEQIIKENAQDEATIVLLKSRIKDRKIQINTIKKAIIMANKEEMKNDKKAKKKAESVEGSTPKNSGVFNQYPVLNDKLQEFIEQYYSVPNSRIKKQTNKEVPCIPKLIYNSDGKVVISTSMLQALWCSVVEHLSLKETTDEGKTTPFIKYEASPFKAFLGDQFNDNKEDKDGRFTYQKFFSAMKGLLDKENPYTVSEA